MNKKEHKTKALELIAEPIKEEVVAETDLDDTSRQILSRRLGEELVLLSNALKGQEKNLTTQGNAL